MIKKGESIKTNREFKNFFWKPETNLKNEETDPKNEETGQKKEETDQQTENF